MDRQGLTVEPGDPFVAATLLTELVVMAPWLRCPHAGRRRWRNCADPGLLLCGQCWKSVSEIAAREWPDEVEAASCCCSCGCRDSVETVNVVAGKQYSARATLCLTCEAAVADALEDLVRSPR